MEACKAQAMTGSGHDGLQSATTSAMQDTHWQIVAQDALATATGLSAHHHVQAQALSSMPCRPTERAETMPRKHDNVDQYGERWLTLWTSWRMWIWEMFAGRLRMTTVGPRKSSDAKPYLAQVITLL